MTLDLANLRAETLALIDRTIIDEDDEDIYDLMDRE